MTTDEEKEKVEVDIWTIWKLVKYYGGIKFVITYNMSSLIFKYFETQTEYTIGKWASDAEVQQNKFKQFLLLILWYAVVQSLFLVWKQIQVFYGGVAASKKIHGEMVKKVVNAPINLYYDVTPSGIILNKFTKDLNTLDDHIHHHLNHINSMIFDIIQIFAIVSLTNWRILLILPFVLAAQFYFLRRTIPAWKDMCKLHSTVRSPMLNQVNETTTGNSTIKAFGRIDKFNSEFLKKCNQLSLQM